MLHSFAVRLSIGCQFRIARCDLMNVISEPVADGATLRRLCRQMEGASHIALDTEFTRIRTYYPCLELIQFATHDLIFCVDASCDLDLSILSSIMQSANSTFVFYAGDQDLEVLELNDLIPRQICDAQIAAQICGATKLSYQRLVKQYLDVSLPKDLTTSNWSRRPISAQQIRYALDDVRYVLPLFYRLQEKLAKLGRLSWLEEENARLLELPRGDQSIAQSWKNFGGGAGFSVAEQHIVKELLTWREQRAKSINWPRQWVLSNQQIRDLVTRQPASRDQVAKLIGIKRRPAPAWVSKLHRIINSTPRNNLTPVWSLPPRLNDSDKALVKRILTCVYRIAEQHNIPGSLLCTRQEASDTVRGKMSARMLQGWRQDIVGAALQPLLKQIQR